MKMSTGKRFGRAAVIIAAGIEGDPAKSPACQDEGGGGRRGQKAPYSRTAVQVIEPETELGERQDNEYGEENCADVDLGPRDGKGVQDLKKSEHREQVPRSLPGG